MKKLLKIGGIVLAIIVLAITTFVVFINVKGIPSYDVPEISYSINPTPEKIARGKKLAVMLCKNCHMNPETQELTGKRMMDAPPEFGTVYSQNITNDKNYGIGDWTDAEIMYLIRTGIKKDGMYAPPYMAKLPNLADEDMEAIISWLRSDDKMMNSKEAVPDRPCEPSFLTKFLSNVAFKPLPMPTEVVQMPDTTNQVELGKYYVTNLECFTCHSEDFKTVNMLTPEATPGFLGGGNLLLNMEGEVMLSSNITKDKATGIGTWNKQRFVKAVRSGIMENEPALRYPMVPYPQLTEYEAGAIYEYLQTVAPLSNPVKRSMIE